LFFYIVGISKYTTFEFRNGGWVVPRYHSDFKQPTLSSAERSLVNLVNSLIKQYKRDRLETSLFIYHARPQVIILFQYYFPQKAANARVGPYSRRKCLVSDAHPRPTFPTHAFRKLFKRFPGFPAQRRGWRRGVVVSGVRQ